MNNKVFLGTIIGIVAVFGIVAVKNDKPNVERPGSVQADNGQQHVASKEYGGTEPPTSGDHSSALPWQEYTTEIRDDNVIHNMEHGGIYISYSPDLPAEQVAQLRALFFKPYSMAGFSPTKAIMAPRANNDAPIIVSSWKRSEKLQSFDEEKLTQYYLLNVGKSPEPSAG